MPGNTAIQGITDTPLFTEDDPEAYENPQWKLMRDAYEEHVKNMDQSTISSVFGSAVNNISVYDLLLEGQSPTIKAEQANEVIAQAERRLHNDIYPVHFSDDGEYYAASAERAEIQLQRHRRYSIYTDDDLKNSFDIDSLNGQLRAINERIALTNRGKMAVQLLELRDKWDIIAHDDRAERWGNFHKYLNAAIERSPDKRSARRVASTLDSLYMVGSFDHMNLLSDVIVSAVSNPAVLLQFGDLEGLETQSAVIIDRIDREHFASGDLRPIVTLNLPQEREIGYKFGSDVIHEIFHLEETCETFSLIQNSVKPTPQELYLEYMQLSGSTSRYLYEEVRNRLMTGSFLRKIALDYRFAFESPDYHAAFGVKNLASRAGLDNALLLYSLHIAELYLESGKFDLNTLIDTVAYLMKDPRIVSLYSQDSAE